MANYTVQREANKLGVTSSLMRADCMVTMPSAASELLGSSPAAFLFVGQQSYVVAAVTLSDNRPKFLTLSHIYRRLSLVAGPRQPVSQCDVGPLF